MYEYAIKTLEDKIQYLAHTSQDLNSTDWFYEKQKELQSAIKLLESEVQNDK